MTVGIYAIYSMLDGVCLYVGQSINIEYRYKKHLQKLSNGSHPRKDFVEWFQTHGSSSTRLEVLESCRDDDETKNKLEQKWFYALKPKFYGKEPSTSERWKHTDATKEKISHSLRVGDRREFDCYLCKRRTHNPKQVCSHCQRSCSRCMFVIQYRSLVEELLLNDVSLRKIYQQTPFPGKRETFTDMVKEWGYTITPYGKRNRRT